MGCEAACCAGREKLCVAALDDPESVRSVSSLAWMPSTKLALVLVSEESGARTHSTPVRFGSSLILVILGNAALSKEGYSSSKTAGTARRTRAGRVESIALCAGGARL